jgi:transmembrane sensor
MAAGVPRRTSRAVGARAARQLVALAAAIVVALGVGLTVRSLSHHTAPTSAGREYATAAGQRLAVTLVDGTQFTLAPASTVRVRAGYGRGSGSRQVELEGEAYFAVVHDAAHPFAVRAHGAVARDVGTAFDVRAYPENVGARIAVAEGAVAVTVAGGCPLAGRRSRPAPVAGEGGPCSADARAGDVATVASGAVAVEHGADIAALTAWTQGRLVFRKTPLADVARELSRAFDLTITVGDSALGSQRITASFDDQSADQVLEDLAAIVGGQFERAGRAVVIRRRGSGAPRHDGSPMIPLTTVHAAVQTTVQAREPGR